MLSLATDMGASIDNKSTRRESASVIADAFPVAGSITTVLAHRADAAVFGAGQPSEDEVKEYWKIVDSSLEDITGSVGFWKRQQARFSPRSLLSDGRAALRRREQRETVPGSGPRTGMSVFAKLKFLFQKGRSGEH